jgi:CubicO group peptidase (beta-lactamase class C family)
MRKRWSFALVLLVFLLISCSASTSPDIIGVFETISPEDAGMSEEKLDALVDFCKEWGSAALLILHDGKVVLSWGEVETKYPVHSIRKALLNSLYGIYVERGDIDLDMTLEELGIDDIPPVLSKEEKQARVFDLIRSRSGVYHPAAAEAQQMIDSRPERGRHPPGSFFYYNNWDFNALGTIFRRTTGKGIFETFYGEIAQPIGMEDFSPADGTYQFERNRSEHPSYFFRMSSRDLARFGLLYQNYGRWEGRQIVPEEWILESTTVYPGENPGGDPYGYLWRIIPEESGLGYGFYHAGFGVHLLSVLPDQRLVLVHRVDTDQDFDIKWSEIRALMEMIVDARQEPPG